MASYSRAGAYLVGVAMGYLMTLYKPDDYRKTVSQFWSILGVAVSLTSMVSVFSLGWYYLLKEYEPLEAAVVAATNRVVWATAICCIIGLCEYGTVPFIPDLLSLPIFTPLSRLSYGIYMIHPLLIQRRIFAKRGPMTFDGLAMVTDTFGDLTLATGLSFAMWLFIEAPFINLCNHLLFNKSKSMSSDVIKQNEEVKAKLL
nr:O-acyltransferase like protein-like [Helicoverpa armigera]